MDGRSGVLRGLGLRSGFHTGLQSPHGACATRLLAPSSCTEAGGPGWAGVRGLRAGRPAPMPGGLPGRARSERQDAGSRPQSPTEAWGQMSLGRGSERSSTLSCHQVSDKPLNLPEPPLAHLSNGNSSQRPPRRCWEGPT